MDLLSLSWWRVVFAKGGRAFALGCALVFILPIVISAGFSLRGGQSNQPTTQAGTLTATVNGQTITMAEFESIPTDSLGGAPGDAHASAYGRAVYNLVQTQVLEQMAKKLNIHATDADIDRAVSKVRDAKVGPNASSTEWENYLSDQMHTSASDFRDSMQGQANIQALVDHYKNAEVVTVDDAKNQYSEVKLSTVFVGSKSPTSGFPGAPKSLPDADALKKATDLHAQAVKGTDIVAMAKANPDPFSSSKTTGISDWRNESKETQFGSALMFGKDMDTAVQKTPKGGITDVVKATGFMSGYVFAKVVDRRINLPKDYEVNKVTTSLKEERAYKKLEADIKAAMKSAKVVFAKDQPGMKAYYDYAALQTMQQEMSGGMMGNASPNPPTQADMETQKALVDADFETLLKTHSDDATAALMVAQSLRSKMATEPLADQAKTRDRLISLYESAFKTTEDIPTRFVLAGLYHDKQDYKSAYKQYAMIIKLLDYPAYDPTTRQKELDTRNQLLTGLNGLPAASVPEAAAAITDDMAKIAVLKVKVEADQQKQKEDQAKQAELQKEQQVKAAQDAAAAKLKAKATTAPTSSGAPSSALPAPATPGSSPAPGATAPVQPAPTGSAGAASPGKKP